MKIVENKLMYRIKKSLSTVVFFFIILSIFRTSTINANEINTSVNTIKNTYKNLPIELLIDLQSVKNQLINQNALDQYPIYEKIIIDSYFSLNKKTYNNFYEPRVSSTFNNKVRNYTVGEVLIKETFLTTYQVYKLYEALSAPDVIKDVVINIMGGFYTLFGLMPFLRERTIREALYQLRQKNLPGKIIESIDARDFNRYTVVASRWYRYPSW